MLCCVVLSKENSVVAVGDSKGGVQVYEMQNPLETEPFLTLCSAWKAHSSRISSIDIVENPRILDAFILTASIDGIYVLS